MKLAKRTLAVLLACLMVFGSFGVVSSAKGNSTTEIGTSTEMKDPKAKGTVTYGLDIYKDGTKLADGAQLAPGDVIEVQLRIKTDFYLGLLSTQIYYDSTYFEPALNGAAYTANVANSFADEDENNHFIKMLTTDAPTAVTTNDKTVTLFDTITPVAKNGIQDFVNKGDNETAVKQWTPLAWRVLNAQGKQLASNAVADEYATLNYIGLSFKCDGDSETGGYNIIVPDAPYFSFQLRVKDGADSNGATTPIFIPIDAAKRTTGQTCNRLYATECWDGVFATKGLPTLGQGYNLANADVDFVIGTPAQHEHSYGQPAWVFADDYTSATATFTCSDPECGDQQTVTDDTLVENIVTPATCTADKVVNYAASVEFNGTTYDKTSDNVTIPDTAIGHIWDTAYSYIDEDTHGIYCTKCGEVDPNSVGNHDYSVDVSIDVPATEDAPGLKTVKCSVCGNAIQVEIPALAHTHEYGEPTWEWAPDGSSATAIFTCVKNDDTVRVPATDIAEEEVEEAECGKDAVYQYVATVQFGEDTYEDTLENVTKPGTALEHSYGEPDWVWGEGYTTATVTFTCENCGDEQTPEVTVTPTTVSELSCTSDYVVYYTASVNFNGTDYTKDSPEVTLEETTGHVYGKPTWNWNDDGTIAIATFTCDFCDDSFSMGADSIDATVLTELTCTTDEVVTYTATVKYNNETYTGKLENITTKFATGHEYGEPVWFFAEDGSYATATFTCSKCTDQQVRTDEAPVEAVVSEAGCLTDKVVNYTATVEFKEQTISKTSDDITVPDSALGHDWPATWTYADEENHEQRCNRCSLLRSEAHNYVKNEEESIPATVEAEGLDVFYCEGCGHKKTETKEKLDHTHQYTSEPTWVWADGYVSATATFTCDYCDDQQVLTDNAPQQKVLRTAGCENDEVISYTATVRFNDTDHVTTADEITVPNTATGHNWGEEPTSMDWQIDGDFALVTATFTCGNCGGTKTVSQEADIVSILEEAGCGKDAVVQYSTTVDLDGTQIVLSSQPVTLVGSALSDHSYGDPEWTWEADYSSAIATFTCTNDNCDHQETAIADIDVTVVQEASCTNDKLVIYTANVVFGGEDYYEDSPEVSIAPATGHDWATAVEPIDDENHGITCTKCGAVKDGTVEAHDYSIDVGIVQEATATEPGLKTVECAVCGHQYDVEYTAEHNHEYGEPTWEWAPDGSSATAIFACIDGDDTQRVSADSILEEEIEEPECGKDGVYQYIATVSFGDDSYSNTLEGVVKTGSALAHSYGEAEWVWAEDGKTATATIICANCGDKQEKTDSAPVENIITPAGCETDKVVTYTATVTIDGKDYSDTSKQFTIADSATGHSYGEAEWTWSADGKSATATITCANCGDKQTKTDNAPVENVVTPAGCETDKVVTYTATVSINGKEYTATSEQYTIPNTALGHNYGEPTWVFSEDGKTATATFGCADCGDQKAVSSSDAPVETVVKAADCVNDKIVTYTATVTLDGKNYTGTSNQITVPGTALGHDFGAWTDNGADTHIRSCSRCEATETAAHTFGDWTVTKEATEKEEGEESRSCTICGRTETRATSKLPISELTLTATDSDGKKTGPAKSIDVTVRYSRKGRMAVQLDASKDGVKYTIDEKGTKSLSIDQDGKVTFSRLRLFSGRRVATITATDSDGQTATCKVTVKLKWWQYIIFFLLFGWLWF